MTNTLYVVNPDADSVSVIDPMARSLLAEIRLGAPELDPTSGAYTPAVMPRALAVSPDGSTVYATGQRASGLFAIDAATRGVTSVVVCSEPIGLVTSGDGAAVFVACAQDDEVVRVDAKTFTVTGRVAVDRQPWSLAWSPSMDALLVSHLLQPTVTVVDPDVMAVRDTWSVPTGPPRGDRRLAHGQPRGMFDLAARPGSNEVWLAHMLLANDTAQPELDFESTVFPSLSVFRDDGVYRKSLSTDGAAPAVARPHARGNRARVRR